MARHPRIQELLNEFVVPQSMTGKRRAVGILYRTLANSMAQQLDDSGELLEALEDLARSKSKAMVASVNPRPVSSTAVARKSGVQGGAGSPKVTGSNL